MINALRFTILLISARAAFCAPGYVNPTDNGGSMLASLLSETYPPGQREPLNVIISATSDSDVLVDSLSGGGLQNYFGSLSFSPNCPSARNVTAIQQADLGDGIGLRNQTEVMRYNYGDYNDGSCTEVTRGGNHFRYWTQNGSEADTGAVFLATSYELDFEHYHHDIIVNGYNLGRDYIVGNITNASVPTLDLTDGVSYSGKTTVNKYTYKTDITYTSGLLSNTSIGINHNETVEIPGVTKAVDGLVAVFEVSIVQRPDGEDGDFGFNASSPTQRHLVEF